MLVRRHPFVTSRVLRNIQYRIISLDNNRSYLVLGVLLTLVVEGRYRFFILIIWRRQGCHVDLYYGRKKKEGAWMRK